jgi:predicted nucleotidyltransferase component of viral defense system
MNLFDNIVTKALENQTELSSLRVVVEKELLHHDILRILSKEQLLKNLTFIGGTCLRSCYGGIRLSEDLDFTGGKPFKREDLTSIGMTLINGLEEKYGLTVKVSEPTKDINNVDTWKIQIQTRPDIKHFPAQRINIDICAVPSYEKRPMVLLNPYGVDMGTSGLIIQAQSREEIYSDKLIAFAHRPNRIKFRDLWDIAWLHGQNIKPNLELIPLKLKDRNLKMSFFLEKYNERLSQLQTNHELPKEFLKEMQRFLPTDQIQSNLWEFIVFLMGDLRSKL